MRSAGLGQAGASERVDPETGAREIAEFVGGFEPMLRFTHLPPHHPIGSVIICPSLYAEFSKNYRREVRLARQLAASGVAAVRLHYRGSGNSMGDAASVTIPGLVADVRETVQDLTANSNLPAPAFLGTRVGAMVATLAADDEAPLVLWEPVFSGARWLKEAIRAATISSVSRSSQNSAIAPQALEGRLLEDGVVDLLGFAVYRNVIDGINDHDLEATLTARRGHTLLVQVGASADPRPSNVQLVDRMRAKGSRVDLTAVKGEVAWWFEGGAAHEPNADDALISSTVSWIVDALAGQA